MTQDRNQPVASLEEEHEWEVRTIAKSSLGWQVL
jgi:hypothetical protein